MNDVLIVSPDKIFARMLFLELDKGNFDIKVISGKIDIAEVMNLSDGASLVVYDADYDGGDLSLVRQLNAPCLLFSRKKLESLPQNAVGFFERPFEVSKFVSFVNSRLLSGESLPENVTQTKKDGLTYDRFSKRFMFGDCVVNLSPKEYELLSLLYKNRGRVVPRKDVLDAIWGTDYNDKNNADNVYVSYLRKKLDDAFGVKMIYTVRGKGYMLK